MGTDIGDLLQKRKIELSDLSNRVVAVDAFNTLHQFLSIIRQRDGSPLVNSRGKVTSHLSGLLYRTASLVEAGIKPVFIFDGKPPDLKSETLSRRKEVRETSLEKWENAKAEGDLEAAYKYAQASSRVDQEIVEDSKYLLGIMGIPWIQAPCEGEAQAAHMVLKKDADYVASQDYDSFLFGAPKVVRNMAVTGKRKLPGKNVYVDVELEVIELEETLRALEINRDQLIDIAICVGTDYNKGLEKVGPKTALKLIKKHGDIHAVLREKDMEIEGLDRIRKLFTHPEVTEDYEIKWTKPDSEKLIKFLCEENDFSTDRVEKAAERLKAASGARQKTLDQWF
ncbi:TPA: flap endonuclease-1 [Methanosarcina acetivorans]|uniref:Flap endonuclease 1 n=2 Tax=Methanosarcina acetivorans TaxID=2214 RepID=FEN_METAC|nr:flap endonuclease-1 [Methanosarcina acetivorans]Q8TIY5.1 RecName: Full=Flap endonuclease 1; Short=FEN-1; AltName: Full=Flap structure-specific endonuclease 1 [Methanosarcina acetivorans C2A]AAM07354.1 FlaP endonuclease-1 [Methanosarcina acetivorans C2A]HIH94765.1 flap endonuclease-1 [Methanosarcina acetivorans]